MSRLTRSTSRVLAMVAIVSLSVAAHSAAMCEVGSAPPSPGGWRADLSILAREMRLLHPNLFFAVSEAEFEAEVADLDRRIPDLTESEVVAEFFRIAALPSRGGRDGHSGIAPFGPRFECFLPLQLYVFSDGVFVAASSDPYRHLIGSRVVRMGRRPIDEAIEALDPLISRDNRMTVLSRLPPFLIVPKLLEGAGIAAGGETIEFLVETVDGDLKAEQVTPIPDAAFREWLRTTLTTSRTIPLYLSNLQERFWAMFLNDSGTLYVQYNVVAQDTQSGETMSQFSERLRAFIAGNEVNRLVIDLRHNGGGNNATYAPFLEMIQANASVNRPGRLFTITSRGTFSAATNFVTDMERTTSTLLVGEASGGSPNQYGDAELVELPNSRLYLFVSTRYHQRSAPDDPRLTHEPDLPAPLSSADYFAGRDPSLDAILGNPD